jgi:hypothetical protein
LKVEWGERGEKIRSSSHEKHAVVQGELGDDTSSALVDLISELNGNHQSLASDFSYGEWVPYRIKKKRKKKKEKRKKERK